MQGRISKICLTVLTLLTTLSCALSELNQTPSEQIGISMDMDWSQLGGAQQPEQMYVYASKYSDRINYAYLYPQMTPVGEDAGSDLIWENGGYKVVCFNRRDDLKLENPGTLKHISLTLPVMAQDEATAELGDIKDFNPGIPYLKDAGEIYAECKTQFINSDPDSKHIVLTPKPMTQELTVRFSIESETDVAINKVTAILSGVSGTVHPMTGVVNYENLHRVILPVTEVSENEGTHQYEAKIRILGLFPPETPEATEGKGILQLAVSAESFLGGRTIYAGINLMNSISEAAPMTVTEENTGYCISGNTCTLEIRNPLKIKTDSVVEDGQDGVDKWYDSENIDINL